MTILKTFRRIFTFHGPQPVIPLGAVCAAVR